MDALTFFQMWCICFSLLVSILTFWPKGGKGWPGKIQDWFRPDWVWQSITVFTLIASSIALYEQFHNGGGGAGGGY